PSLEPQCASTAGTLLSSSQRRRLARRRCRRPAGSGDEPPGAAAVSAGTATTAADRSWRLWRRLGRRGVLIAIVVVLGATVAAAWVLLGDGSPHSNEVVDRASSLATITERTITAQQQVNGTLGFA